MGEVELTRVIGIASIQSDTFTVYVWIVISKYHLHKK